MGNVLWIAGMSNGGWTQATMWELDGKSFMYCQHWCWVLNQTIDEKWEYIPLLKLHCIYQCLSHNPLDIDVWTLHFSKEETGEDWWDTCWWISIEFNVVLYRHKRSSRIKWSSQSLIKPDMSQTLSHIIFISVSNSCFDVLLFLLFLFLFFCIFVLLFNGNCSALDELLGAKAVKPCLDWVLKRENLYF